MTLSEQQNKVVPTAEDKNNKDIELYVNEFAKMGKSIDKLVAEKLGIKNVNLVTVAYIDSALEDLIKNAIALEKSFK